MWQPVCDSVQTNDRSRRLRIPCRGATLLGKPCAVCCETHYICRAHGVLCGCVRDRVAVTPSQIFEFTSRYSYQRHNTNLVVRFYRYLGGYSYLDSCTVGSNKLRAEGSSVAGRRHRFVRLGVRPPFLNLLVYYSCKLYYILYTKFRLY